jgi:flavin-dependent dehydrogenase
MLKMVAADAPDLTRTELVADVIGTIDCPLITRERIVTSGVALIGDAARVSDPLWGIGCGWAFRTAK